jgi:hypothetical protein
MTNFNLPRRDGPHPKTGLQPPQLQFSDMSPQPVYEQIADWMFSSFPKAREEPTRISVASSRALWLDENVVASQEAFMPPAGSREFAHLHRDGSLHLVLNDRDQQEVLQKGWGLPHPWQHRGVNEILVFAPRNQQELELLKPVVAAAYENAVYQREIVSTRRPSNS